MKSGGWTVQEWSIQHLQTRIRYAGLLLRSQLSSVEGCDGTKNNFVQM